MANLSSDHKPERRQAYASTIENFALSSKAVTEIAKPQATAGRKVIFDIWSSPESYIPAQKIKGASGREYIGNARVDEHMDAESWSVRWADWSKQHSLGFSVTPVEKSNYYGLRVSFFNRNLTVKNEFVVESNTTGGALDFLALPHNDELVIVAKQSKNLIITRYNMLDSGKQLSQVRVEESSFGSSVQSLIHMRMPRYITDDGCIVMPYYRYQSSVYYYGAAKINIETGILINASLYSSSSSNHAITAVFSTLSGDYSQICLRGVGVKRVDWSPVSISNGALPDSYYTVYGGGSDNGYNPIVVADMKTRKIITCPDDITNSSSSSHYMGYISVLNEDLYKLSRGGIKLSTLNNGHAPSDYMRGAGLIVKFDQIVAYDTNSGGANTSCPVFAQFDSSQNKFISTNTAGFPSANKEYKFSTTNTYSNGYSYLSSIKINNTYQPITENRYLWGTNVNNRYIRWWKTGCITDNGRLLLPGVYSSSGDNASVIHSFTVYPYEYDFGPTPVKILVTAIGGGFKGGSFTSGTYYAEGSKFGDLLIANPASSNSGYLASFVSAPGQASNGYLGYGSSYDSYSGFVEQKELTVSGRVGIHVGHGFRRVKDTSTSPTAKTVYEPRMAADGAVIIEFLE